MSIMVAVRATMDIEQIWQSCHLAENDQLRFVLLWHSSGTNLRRQGNFVTIQRNGMAPPFLLTAHIDGTELAEEIKIELQLVLAQPGNSSSKLAPHRPGSILWRESRVVKIEGEGSRFPVEAIDFGDQFQSLPAQAAWFLDWNPTALDEPFLRSVRLFLNKEHKAVRKAIQNRTKEDKLLLEMIHFDVSKDMITAALRNDEFVQNHQNYKPGTVGAAIRNMIVTFFPGKSIDRLSGDYRFSPSRVECELQAGFELFKEV
jgi:hypothetical protein